MNSISQSQYNMKKNKRKSMADELSKEMNLLLENTNKNYPTHTVSMSLPQRNKYIPRVKPSTSYYNTSNPMNTHDFREEYNPYSSSPHIQKNRKSLKYSYQESLEEKYNSLYETESSSYYTTTEVAHAVNASNTPTEEDNNYTTTSTNTSDLTSDQFSDYTSSSNVPSEFYSDYSKSTEEPSSSMDSVKNGSNYSAFLQHPINNRNENINNIKKNNVVNNYSNDKINYDNANNNNTNGNGVNKNINTGNDTNINRKNFRMSMNTNNYNHIIDERLSRPISRWSQQNVNNRRNHSLDSRQSRAKSKDKRKSHRGRNRSFSPSIKNLLLDASHFSDIYNSSFTSNSSINATSYILPPYPNLEYFSLENGEFPNINYQQPEQAHSYAQTQPITQQQKEREQQQVLAQQKERGQQQALAEQREREKQQALAQQKEREQQQALAEQREREKQQALAEQREREKQQALAEQREREKQQALVQQREREQQQALAKQQEKEQQELAQQTLARLKAKEQQTVTQSKTNEQQTLPQKPLQQIPHNNTVSVSILNSKASTDSANTTMSDNIKSYSFDNNSNSNSMQQTLHNNYMSSIKKNKGHKNNKNNKSQKSHLSSTTNNEINNNNDTTSNLSISKSSSSAKIKSPLVFFPSSVYANLPSTLPYQLPSENNNNSLHSKTSNNSLNQNKDSSIQRSNGKYRKDFSSNTYDSYKNSNPPSLNNKDKSRVLGNISNTNSVNSSLNRYMGMKNYNQLSNYYLDVDSPNNSIPYSSSSNCSTNSPNPKIFISITKDQFKDSNNSSPCSLGNSQNKNNSINLQEFYDEFQTSFWDGNSITHNIIDNTEILTPSLSSIDEQQYNSDYCSSTTDNILNNARNKLNSYVSNDNDSSINNKNLRKNNSNNIMYNSSDNNYSTTFNNNNYTDPYQQSQLSKSYKNENYYCENNKKDDKTILDNFYSIKDTLNEISVNDLTTNNYNCMTSACQNKVDRQYSSTETDITTTNQLSNNEIDASFYQYDEENKELTDKSRSNESSSSYTIPSSVRERFNNKRPPYPLNPTSSFYKPPNPKHHPTKNKKKVQYVDSNGRLLEEGCQLHSEHEHESSISSIRRKHSLIKPERSRRISKYKNYVRDNSNYIIVENDINNGHGSSFYRCEQYEQDDWREEEWKRQSNFNTKKNIIDPEFDNKIYDNSNDSSKKSFKNKWWSMIAKTCTCCVPKACLAHCNKTEPDVQQAWREKVTLCIIVLIICLISGFFTFGVNMIFCSGSADKIHYKNSTFSIHGVSYDITINNYNETNRLHNIIGLSNGYDIGQYFVSSYPREECKEIMGKLYSNNTCSSSVIGQRLSESHRNNRACYTMEDLKGNPKIEIGKVGNVYYTWEDLKDLQNERKLVVYNGSVLDLTDYLASNKNSSIGHDLNNLLMNRYSLDTTYAIAKDALNKKAMKCMDELYKVGIVGKTTSGCIIGNIILALTLIFVFGVIIIKFCMAVIFDWFLKWSLGDRYGVIKKIAEKERNNDMDVLTLTGTGKENSRFNSKKGLDSATTLINKNGSKVTKLDIDENEWDRQNGENTPPATMERMERMASTLTLKSQNRKSMTSRFSTPMPGEGSRLNNSIIMPKYPNPFKSDSGSNNNSFADLTILSKGSLNWEPSNSNSPIGSVLNNGSVLNKNAPIGSIFGNQSVTNSPSLLANSNNPLVNGTIKTMPEPTLPDMGILDDEIPPSSPALTTKSNANPSLTNRYPTVKSTSSPIDQKSTLFNRKGSSCTLVEESSGGPLTPKSTIKDLLHTILLVTCYSEGHDGIASTLDSLSNTDYPDSLKLIIVICDGLVKGEGNDELTADIVIDMIDPGDGSNYQQQEPKSYVAIAEGQKRRNMAQIYAGWYRYAKNLYGRRIPMIGIIKCGTPQERYGPQKSSKPGNRGKRDSQVLLLGFLSRVLFNERMTEFDFDLFTKIYELTGVHADAYESIMMVDADTVVDKDSLAHLTACLIQDPKIMGLCGETRIANKTKSWVTMIQVFEYYISHHMSKAFESVFGGVTCLPGCFCMYRIKSRKGDHGYWVPILANPEIVEQYSENIVNTLHKKNLLLLGEDRYLSTLMLREFPKRKMVFVPQATCHTIVPSNFRVLLSQRRRWINSTIHNLLELVLVNDLCGTFCISMQFVVFMELLGTMILPAATIFLYYLIINAIFNSHKNVFILCLMGLIMGLPAILIALTSRKFKYIFWMIIYLLALPVWNFILPIYAFWHFDDFSWGQTRLVEGERADKNGYKAYGKFDSTGIVMKTWEEWEKLRRVGLLANEYHEKETDRKEGDIGEFSNFYNAVLARQARSNSYPVI